MVANRIKYKKIIRREHTIKMVIVIIKIYAVIKN